MSLLCTLLLIYSATNTHCSKSNPNFCDITLNVVENMILNETFRVVSRVSHYISCYVAENQFPLGQCTITSLLICRISNKTPLHL